MKKFSELTLKGQKMRIVRDAIAQIKGDRFLIATGTYLGTRDGSDWTHVYENGYKDLKSFLLKPSKTPVCECCAKGAIFASCVINVNKVKTNEDIYEDYFQKTKLEKWFSVDELDMIETAFELQVIADDNGRLQDGDWELTDAGVSAIRFGRKYKIPEKRLLAILENILENGSFKP